MIFLKIPGMPGESQIAGHETDIEAMSLSWGVTQPGTAAFGAGSSKGKGDITDVMIVHKLEQASPLLFKAMCTGQHVPQIQIFLTRTGLGASGGGPGGFIDYMEYTLKDVMVSSLAWQTSGEDIPMETVSFNFVRMEMKYREIDPVTGQPGGFTPAGYDIAQAMKL